MQLCVLGAGVVGVTSAWRLLEEGHSVTLVDAHATPGQGASRGNGAQLSYSYVAPLADPSVWTKWPYYLFSRESPLTLRPRLDPAQWRWLSAFLAASNAGTVRQTTVDLLRLAYFSRDQLGELMRSTPVEFGHRMAGKLVMFTDEASLQGAAKQVAFQADYGSKQQVLDAKHCLEIEPALAQANRPWVGGVYTADEAAGDCEAFCRGLVEKMQANPRFRLLANARVTDVRVEQGRIASVRAGDENLDAEAFVLALGAGSANFAQRAGFYLPIYPLKGYSITVPLKDVSRTAAPQVSITDISRKIVYARLGDHVRVAGRVELVGMDPEIPERAFNELRSSVAEMFPNGADLSNDAALMPWAGFRPATPTGLPIVGRSPLPNLYLNVGHGALGWTLSSGSAALLADHVAGRPTAIDAAAFAYRH